MKTVRTGDPQGCVCSPLLFYLFSYDCTYEDTAVKLLTFAENTMIIRLIKNDDKSAYGQEVEQLVLGYSRNNPETYMQKQ